MGQIRRDDLRLKMISILSAVVQKGLAKKFDANLTEGFALALSTAHDFCGVEKGIPAFRRDDFHGSKNEFYILQLIWVLK